MSTSTLSHLVASCCPPDRGRLNFVGMSVESVAARQRDLFPLPFLQSLNSLRSGRSKCRPESRAESKSFSGWTNGGIGALNQLAGRGDAPACNLPLPPQTIKAADRVAEEHSRFDNTHDVSGSDADALDELIT